MNKKVVLRESKKIVITLGMVASLVACTKEKPQEVNNDNKAESTVSTENVSQTPILKMDGSVEFKYGKPLDRYYNDYIEIGPNAYVTHYGGEDVEYTDEDITYGFYSVDGKNVLRCLGVENADGSDVVAEFDDKCSNEGCAYESIIYFTCGKKAYQYNMETKESGSIEAIGNYDIDRMYVVNDDVLVFSTGHDIYEYSVKEDLIYKYDNEIQFTDFVPTSYGMVTYIKNDNAVELYMDNERVFENLKISFEYFEDSGIVVSSGSEELINAVMDEKLENMDWDNEVAAFIHYCIDFKDLKNDETLDNWYYIFVF